MEWTLIAGLRFFLSWIVFCGHLKWFVSSHDFSVQFTKLGPLSAVIGFLLVSGYSIGSSITKKSEGFYKRRIFRIYPLYFCAILISYLPFILHNEPFLISNVTLVAPKFFDVLANLSFMQGFIVSPISSNGIVWTLSIEIFYYALTPLFLKMNTKTIVLLIIFSGSFYAIYPYLHLPYFSDNKYGLNALAFLWAWLLGFLYFREQSKEFSKILMLSLGCLLIYQNNLYNERFSLLTYVISCLTLIYANSPQVVAALKNSKNLAKLMRYLGDLSYPLYLFHFPALLFGSYILKLNTSFQLICFCLILSVFAYHIGAIGNHKKKTDCLLT